jgi:nitrite reductase/ring-hydroxylating ferredoxin subunit
MKFVHVGDRDLLIANVDGKYHAIHNWCTHEEGNLSDGELKRNVVTCPEHGAQFDVTTGKVLVGRKARPRIASNRRRPTKSRFKE